MIIKQTQNVNIYLNTTDSGMKRTPKKIIQFSLTGEFTDLYIEEVLRKQNSQTQANPLAAGPSEKMVNYYRILMNDYLLVFKNMGVAQKYFDFILSNTEKTLEDVYPELFL